MKRWRYREFDPAVVDRLQAENGLSRLPAVLLAQRSITDPEQAARFLQPELSQLHDPYRMLGMKRAVERLRRAIHQQERILIYGDYDVDGTTGVVVLRKAIELAGGSADFHVPHRVKDGYGMRRDIIERAAHDEVRLIVSVDTGIRERAVVQRANELGIDCIITDHHLPEEAVPPALAVLNPNQSGCSYPDKNLSGAGVTFKLSQALLSGLEWAPSRLHSVLHSMLKVVAIGTVADVVPLLGENRVFVTLGIEGLRQPRNPGLKALLDVAGLSAARSPTAGDIAFRLAPRLNAAGRMESARSVIELLTSGRAERAAEIAQKLDRLNTDRQQSENAIVTEVVERLEGIPPPDEAPCIVEAGEAWHPGVIGIVASRIVERYHRPTLILSLDTKQGTATGSGRTIHGFHLLEGLESVSELFERFGGHRQAAGCTLAIERIPELRRRLSDHARRVIQPEDFVPTLDVDSVISFQAITDETMGQMTRLAPHGVGNPTPVFSASGVRLLGRPRLVKEKHLKLTLEQEGVSRAAIGWRMGDHIDGLEPSQALDAAFSIERDYYWGGWQLVLRDFRLAES